MRSKKKNNKIKHNIKYKKKRSVKKQKGGKFNSLKNSIYRKKQYNKGIKKRKKTKKKFIKAIGGSEALNPNTKIHDYLLAFMTYNSQFPDIKSILRSCGFKENYSTMRDCGKKEEFKRIPVIFSPKDSSWPLSLEAANAPGTNAAVQDHVTAAAPINFTDNKYFCDWESGKPWLKSKYTKLFKEPDNYNPYVDEDEDEDEYNCNKDEDKDEYAMRKEWKRISKILKGKSKIPCNNPSEHRKNVIFGPAELLYPFTANGFMALSHGSWTPNLNYNFLLHLLHLNKIVFFILPAYNNISSTTQILSNYCNADGRTDFVKINSGLKSIPELIIENSINKLKIKFILDESVNDFDLLSIEKGDKIQIKSSPETTSNKEYILFVEGINSDSDTEITFTLICPDKQYTEANNVTDLEIFFLKTWEKERATMSELVLLHRLETNGYVTIEHIDLAPALTKPEDTLKANMDTLSSIDDEYNQEITQKSSINTQHHDNYDYNYYSYDINANNHIYNASEAELKCVGNDSHPSQFLGLVFKTENCSVRPSLPRSTHSISVPYRFNLLQVKLNDISSRILSKTLNDILKLKIKEAQYVFDTKKNSGHCTSSN